MAISRAVMRALSKITGKPRALQHRAEGGQLAAVRQEAGQGGGVSWAELRHLGGQPRQIAMGLQLAASLEHQAVLRIEPDQLDLILQPPPAGSENVGKHARIEEECRPHVEAKRSTPGRRGDGG